MVKYFNASKDVASRVVLSVVILSVLLFTSGCGLFGAKRKISVDPLLTPLAEASKERLIQEVNWLATIKSIRGKVDIQFEDTSFASAGVADQYRLVDGDLTLQRPGKILLIIQFTFVDIAQMASDGEHFSVAMLKGPEKYRRFVKGTNNASYPKLADVEPATATKANSQKQQTEKETVSALSNLRPQHLTDAFMIRPIDTGSSFIYAQSEYFQDEPDTRRQARKNGRVVRGYYLLEEFTVNGSDAKLTRRFWFDRVEKIRLARVQTYDERGRLVTDISYSNEKTVGNGTTASLPSRIEITRPQDQYKLSISYQDSTSVELNREIPARAFVLENKWQLPELDLDTQIKKVTANQ
jgi:hypothetical protein